MVILLLACYPIGLINYSLKNPTIRLWYGLLTGFLLQYLMYQNHCIHIIAATIGTYLFICLFGRKLSAFWVLGITVLHLSALHIYRMIVDWGGWNLDITTIYMMSICKFSALAFSYEDGGKPDEELKSNYFRSK
jgi:lysophospholipid acyltransferase